MILCWGMNDRGAAASPREALAFTADTARAFLAALRAEGIGEVLLLATCNRTEFYLADSDPQAVLRLTAALARTCPEGLVLLQAQGYQYADRAAMQHLTRVAASLDAMVVGESQILGQVKAAYALAESVGTIGPVLRGVIPRVLTIAKRVRHETEIARHPVSVSSVAVALARQIFETLRACTVAVVGTGEMGVLAARHLRREGVARLLMVNRTWGRVETAAEELAAEPHPWEALTEVLVEADIVVWSASAPGALLDAGQMAIIQGYRGERPLFLIDIAFPHGIAPAVRELPNVYLYGLDDLQAVAAANREAREDSVQQAELLIGAAVPRHWEELCGGAWRHTVASLHQKCEDIRRRELERTFARLGDATPELRSALEDCTQAIIAKILHDPIVQLKQQAQEQGPDSPHIALAGNWLRRLFRLDVTGE